MPIHNVSETHHDHVCAMCGASKLQNAHEKIERLELSPGKVTLVIECANGHRESFTSNLEESEETNPERSEFGREQVRNVRALYRHCKTLELPFTS